MRNENAIKLEIHGKNELNRIAGLEIANVLPQLEKYLNTKIETLQGFSKKFVINFLKPTPQPLDNGFAQNHGAYLTCSYGSLRLHVKLCFNGGKHENKTYYCQYFDRTYHLADIKDNVLTKVENIDKVYSRKVIDFETEKAKLIEIEELTEKLRELKYSLNVEI